jgi:hypothetical protein
METVLLQLFNWLWTGEVMPTAWSQGVIVNLSKLETQQPGNYRGNTGLDLPQDVHEHPAEAPGNDGGPARSAGRVPIEALMR